MKFEESLIRLEKILQEIESRDLDIDKLINLFEEGNTIASKCQKDLTRAKSRMNIIMKENSKIKTKDFK